MSVSVSQATFDALTYYRDSAAQQAQVSQEQADVANSLLNDYNAVLADVVVGAAADVADETAG